MNNKGFQFKDGFFSIIVVSMLVISYGTILVEWNKKYGQSENPDLDSFNKLSEISDITQQGRGKITPENQDPGENAETNTFRGVYGILTGMYSTFDIVIGNGGLIDDLTNRFDIPDYVRQGIVAMILVSITIGLITVIFRLGRSSA